VVIALAEALRRASSLRAAQARKGPGAGCGSAAMMRRAGSGGIVPLSRHAKRLLRAACAMRHGLEWPLRNPSHRLPDMNRLQLEVHRLYAPRLSGGQDAADPYVSSLVDAGGAVRAMVLELARPADWAALSKVWRGVQADLELPAPAIAVNGKDGYQLWFSLSEPVPAGQAWAFLGLLRDRYLGEVRPQRVDLMPAAVSSSPGPARHAGRVPAPQAGSEHWSAYVASDLAPMFAEEPWIDMPPNPDGQAALLSPLKSIAPDDLRRALERLRPAAAAPSPQPPAADGPAVAGTEVGPMSGRPAPGGPWLEPRRFLLGVMNDDRAALALRIEAAKALLPYFDDPRRP
jgi:hypothetical protein